MLLKKIFSLLFPNTCLSCSVITEEGQHLCIECSPKIKLLSDLCYCWYCGHTSPAPDELCVTCFNSKRLFSQIGSILAYDENSNRMIFRFKFQDDISKVKIYARWLYHSNEEIFAGSDLIIPVPLHRKRLFWRKYNQAALIANQLSICSSVPVDLFSLKRVLPTQSQASLPKNLREQNVEKAFAVRKNGNILNKVIILTDDVLTTGATLHSCAKVLLESGAKEIRALTIARVIDTDL